MVGASSRLISLVTNPISLLHHRPFLLLRLGRPHTLTLSAAPNHLYRLCRPTSAIPIKFSQSFYSRATNSALQETKHIPAGDYHPRPTHPWQEWSRLLESLSVAGYFEGNGNIEDEFVANENLSMEFVAAANSCLAFAHDRPDILRWLPRKDIEVLVNDGHPFLFRSADESERRMRSFLQAEELNEASSVDLMKYILSYASHPIIYPERNISEAIESSVRSLLQEMGTLSRSGQQFQVVRRYEQRPRNLGPNITMKRGDWICPKCSFMNFARNTRCLECEDLRPQKQLADGNWDCPRCNFYNFGRNSACLKCDYKRPDETLLPGSPGQGINSHHQNMYGGNDTPGVNNFQTTNNIATSNQSLDNSSRVSGTYTKNFDRGQNDDIDSRSSITMGRNSGPFVPLPTDMFVKKPERMANEHGEEAAVRTPVMLKTVEESQSSEKATSYFESRHTGDTDTEDNTARWFKKVKELHGVTEPNSDFPQIMPMRKGDASIVDNKKDQLYSSHKKQQAMEQGSSSSFAPFVPFPPGYFAKKDDQQPSRSTDSTMKPTDRDEISSRENLNNSIPEKNLVQDTGNPQMNLNNLNASLSIGEGQTNTADSTSNQFRRQESSRPEASNIGQKTPEKLNVKSGWTGKSLEGSAVTEPDPLDMSEEAKAERWFRRVAQIKDISELSQIPDEDFPSIMPMRKGVNRFVVSKRKTPLERRLTSPQYRKNLRIMSSESMKKEGNDDN